ncbi:MAG: ROK family protein [Cytophagales bacterium]|nr:ROK family protein [Cytophagales bacterium]
MNHKSMIGVDLGGTNVRAGLISDHRMAKLASRSITSQGAEAEVLKEVIDVIDRIYESDVAGIGVGVPGVVDTKNGIVYDVQNIPSWKEVYLKLKTFAYSPVVDRLTIEVSETPHIAVFGAATLCWQLSIKTTP